MTIPKSYEALAADLASEKILSKTLIGQKEAYMMLADHLKLDLATWKQKACEAAEREAALREEIDMAKQVQETTDAIVTMVDGQRDHWIEKCGLLKQRLAVAERRAAYLKKLLCDVISEAPTGFAALKVDLAHRVNDALKPADHPQCEECKGWGYHENHHEGGGTECGECGGSGNATVAAVMVMPDRMKVEPFTTIDRGSKNYKAGYNAALAEVARLNEVKP